MWKEVIAGVGRILRKSPALSGLFKFRNKEGARDVNADEAVHPGK